MARRIVILGSTGSIGKSALDVVRRYPGRFEVVGLAARSNAALLSRQVEEFVPRYVCAVDADAARATHANGGNATVLEGADGLKTLASLDVDVVLCAMVGAVGLDPILAAIDAGNTVALANKEPLVMAGPLIMDRARARGVRVLPVDSEHNAIFQCLEGHAVQDVLCIHLTASGGPFYRRPPATLTDVSPDEAARHPTWDMGRKISVDSATLMNKGLEIVEAMWLFGIPVDKIQVVIHPQSIVHSLVEFNDGSILAHLGPTDMRFPILFALTWPERVEKPMGRLDLTRMRDLTFAAPDFAEFPCLALALEAARRGGTAPALLNAANETAVSAFCDYRLPFLGIGDIIRHVLDSCAVVDEISLDTVMAADAAGRRCALERIALVGVKT